MTQTKIFTQPIAETHQSTSTPIFTELLQDTNPLPVGVVPCADPGCADPDYANLVPASVPTSISNFPDPFSIYQQPLTNAIPQPVQWLWQHRLPLAGITLLDGDRRLGKTLLAHQIAAAVSSGSPMPDGTPTIQGGVIIITPDTDATTTQLQQLTDLGADLSRIQILTYIHDSVPTTHPSGRRRFSLPEDLPLLFDAIDQLDARLIILDPFINTLSRQRTSTARHLNHLLADLNQRLIERRVACLLVRNCHARGGQAKPTALERSDHFPIIAISHLLLAPDPIEPNHILLSHALSRHAALTPTLTLHIQPLPTNPNLPHFTVHGTHHLTATHLLTQRPDTLHRQLLCQHLYSIISHATEPVSVTTLSTQSLPSSPSQVQLALKDLLQSGQILRPTRGFYTLNPTATTELESPAAITLSLTEAPTLEAPATTTPTLLEETELESTAATTPNSIEESKLESTAAITPNPTTSTELEAPATTVTLTKATEVEVLAAIKLNAPAATTPSLIVAPKLETPAATTLTPTSANKLNVPAAITSTPAITNKLNTTATTTPKSKTQHPHKHPSKHKKWHGRPGQSKKTRRADLI